MGYLTIGLLVIVTIAEIGFALWLLIPDPRETISKIDAEWVPN